MIIYIPPPPTLCKAAESHFLSHSVAITALQIALHMDLLKHYKSGVHVKLMISNKGVGIMEAL